MRHPHPKHLRILAVAPSTRGFGFAVFEGQGVLVDWGVKSVQGDKNRLSLVKAEEMIRHYQPEVIVLEDLAGEDCRRSTRIRTLSRRLVALAARLKVRVEVLARDQVKRTFFAEGEGTKHALAEIIAQHFPEELGSRLPPKRKPWKSEDCRMDIFAAVALALAFRLQSAGPTAYHLPKHDEGDANSQ